MEWKTFPFYNLFLLIGLGIHLSVYGFYLSEGKLAYSVALCGALLIGHGIWSSILMSNKFK
ncbi:hypothetical protein [Nosocomiicoccus massiliensis]|uniref:hypothetical protein n=1 Tax=Nosocomiicoccus massiliensis TaxID=1232430 RepID=UPI0005934D46|nr:hypothetical protein [Nosocomiicoccus massiliensis]